MKPTAALLLAALLAALFAPPTSPAGAQDEAPTGSMLIILDASGSMNNVDEDGVPFIDKAKDAVLSLTAALPDHLAVGLRVYGHREPNTDAERGCLDTELLVPVGPVDRAAISRAVEGVGASGFTPIGLSLREAAADLPEAGARSIVLISDGEDTCAPPDPCDVAEELYADAIDVRIETIGFLVDTGSAAEQQLRCIAEVSGGEYRTVGRADELIAKLSEVADEVLDWRPVLALNGALEQAAAPAVPLRLIPDWLAEEPPTFARGEYTSVIMPGETRWFRVETWQGEGFWSFADLEGPPGTDVTGDFEAIIVDPSGNRVEVPAHEGMARRVTLPGTDSPMIGVTHADPPRGGPRPVGTYLLGFHWDAPSDVFLGTVRFSIDILGDYREAERIEVTGALDPVDAPFLELEPLEENGPSWLGNSFHGPISAGETRWYRLDTGADREMNVFARFPAHRVVGTGLDGEFTIEVRDLAGAPVGESHSEQPQLVQTFGAERHQAQVSATTESAPDPLPEEILVGFTWDGSGGESLIWFQVETIYNGGRAAAGAVDGSDSDEDGGAAAGLDVAARSPADEEPESGGVATVVVIAAGLVVLALLVVFALVLRRRRRS